MLLIVTIIHYSHFVFVLILELLENISSEVEKPRAIGALLRFYRGCQDKGKIILYTEFSFFNILKRVLLKLVINICH